MILEFGTKPLDLGEIFKGKKNYDVARLGEYVKITIDDKEKTIIKKLKDKGFNELHK